MIGLLTANGEAPIRKETTMNQLKAVVAGLATAAASVAIGMGLAAGVAQAQPDPMVCQDPTSPPGPANFCTYQWCPGSPVMKNMPDWDMSVCHPWYFDENSRVTDSIIIEGFPDPPPPRFYGPCPPFAFLCP